MTLHRLRRCLERNYSQFWSQASTSAMIKIQYAVRSAVVTKVQNSLGDLRKTLEGHSSSVRAMALSLDHTQIASDSGHQITKFTDIPKSLKSSKSLRTHSRGVSKLKSKKKVREPEITSLDYRYLQTSSGSALKGEIATDKLEGKPSFLYSLSVQE
ncbi:hypothetical protein N7495_000989 [Penicillium taxi]|uniref:uncharacterized protein n=1 Tax=Penicillium taxi TaxID=168475 RepID=UPI002545514F|nr:uncharacterized protein N7495_000989 [Penicillium taxi]KAJ5908307.1 hypothetical protein N7495_000989 [Penicillium taxi]